MGSARLLGVVLVALGLSGCVTSAPEPGLSDAEAAALQQAFNDSSWQATGLSDDLRPADPSTEFVPSEEWVGRFVSCMNDAGYDNYEASPDGFGYSVEDQGRTDSEQLTFYICDVSYRADYDELVQLNHAEMDYWYDYYKQELVPCLENHDVPIFEAPTRAEFHEDFGTWNPYWSVRPKDQEFVFSDEQLHRECPFVPPGADYPDPFAVTTQ